MANHVIKDPPEFSDALRKLEVSDPNHANTFNPLFEKLINNDVFLKAFTEALSASLGEVGEDVASVQQALDAHLAETATDGVHGAGQANGLATLDENGNVPEAQLGNIPNTVWQKIDEITLDVDTAQLDITGLELYNEIRIIGENVLSTGSDVDLKVNFNNNSDTNAYFSYFWVGTTLSSQNSNYLKLGSIAISSDTSEPTFFDLRIMGNNTCIYDYVGASGKMGRGVGRWSNANELSSVQLAPLNYLFKAGAIFEIWGR